MSLKLTKKRCLWLPALLLLAAGSCESSRELLTLSKCEFRLSNVEEVVLAGVDVGRVQRLDDVSLADLVTLYEAAGSAHLPLELTVVVEVKNPNERTAALNKAEWTLFIDGYRISSGVYEGRVEVPPRGGIASFRVPVSADLKEVLGGESQLAMINLGLNLADIGSQPTRITLRTKPYIMVGDRLIAYPSHVDVQTTFTSGGEN
jgi:LEA14-like dessication related protein